MKTAMIVLICMAGLAQIGNAAGEEPAAKTGDAAFAEEVEVVVTTNITRRTRSASKTPAPAFVNEGKPAEAKQDGKAAKEAPPPPIPPASDAEEPRRIIRYFCHAWKNEDYLRMYWAMDAKYRKAKPLRKFQALLENDKATTGGVVDENITVDDKRIGANVQVTVDLRFRNRNYADRRVKALVVKTKDGYRILDSGIVPLDLKDL